MTEECKWKFCPDCGRPLIHQDRLVGPDELSPSTAELLAHRTAHAEARITRAREQHFPVYDKSGHASCSTCQTAWPCVTHRALADDETDG